MADEIQIVDDFLKRERMTSDGTLARQWIGSRLVLGGARDDRNQCVKNIDTLFPLEPGWVRVSQGFEFSEFECRVSFNVNDRCVVSLNDGG